MNPADFLLNLGTLCRFGAFLPSTLPPAPAPSAVPLAEALEAAVARALAHARPPVAVALSGGLDSTLVAVVARRLWGPSLKAYVLASGSAPVQARFVAARLGLDLIAVPAVPAGRVSPREVARALGQPTHSAAPFAFLPFWRALAEAGVGTVLTGDGADELFAGHAYHRSAGDVCASAGPVPGRAGVPADLWTRWAATRALGIDAAALLCHPGPDWTETPAAARIVAELTRLDDPAERLRWLDVRLRMRPQCVELQARLVAAAGLAYAAPFAAPEVVSAALAHRPAPDRPKAPLAALASAWLGTDFAPEKEPVRAETGGPLSPEMDHWTHPALTVEAGLFHPAEAARLRAIDPAAPYLPRGLLVVATAHAVRAL